MDTSLDFTNRSTSEEVYGEYQPTAEDIAAMNFDLFTEDIKVIELN